MFLNSKMNQTKKFMGHVIRDTWTQTKIKFWYPNFEGGVFSREGVFLANDCDVKHCRRHKLFNKVFGVILRHLERFWCAQTSMGSNFSCCELFSFKIAFLASKDAFKNTSHFALECAKKCLYVSRCLWWLSETCLGPSISAELNSVIIHCVNRFLCYQT